MKLKPKQPVLTSRSREIYGLLCLALSGFLSLCLFSYDARDPSFSTLNPDRRTQNLGGIVGAHLSDLLFTFLGYSAYLIPVALVGVALSLFIEKRRPGEGEVVDVPKTGFRRTLAYSSLVLISALLLHIKLGSVLLGGKKVDAGGLSGYWLGGQMVQLLGRLGSYLFLSLLFVISLLSVTQASFLEVVKKIARFIGFFAVHLAEKFSQWFTVLMARARQSMAEWWKSRKEQAKKKDPVISVVKPVSIPASRVVTPRNVPAKELPPPVISREVDVVQNALGGEPKILPRADLQEKKDSRRDQLELITTKIADYELPQLSFLDSESQVNIKIDEEALKLNSKLLEKKLLDYGVEGRITEIHPGPIITMYEFEPAAGVKVNKIVNLEDDLSLTMGGKSVRIVAPLPGKPAVGIEIPNNERETVWLKDVIGHGKFQKADSKLILALGKDTEGIPFVSDLAKMPHLLVAGATGSGKSVQVNSILMSVLYKATPEEVRMILIDPKMLELSIYEGIPHLLLPVVTQPKKASMALRWAVGEMERRYEILTKKSARNIAGYNKTVSKEEKLPYIVIIIDELADLMMTAAKDVEASVTRLAQMARAAGIHLILATQRPSVDVITGLIKANFPARISFKVSSKHDSRTIIDTVGAEHLLGAGDMLFMSGGASNMLRVHGAYVSETEILRVVEHWKKQGQPQFLDESVLKPVEEESEKSGGGFEEDLSDDLYDQAVTLVTETRQASISMVQRRLRIGYNRAARMIERMEKEGVVGPADGARPREVYAQSIAQDLPE